MAEIKFVPTKHWQGCQVPETHILLDEILTQTTTLEYSLESFTGQINAQFI